MGGSISKSKDFISILVMILAFIATYIFKINVMYIILICGTIGALKVIFKDSKKKVGDAKWYFYNFSVVSFKLGYLALVGD